MLSTTGLTSRQVRAVSLLAKGRNYSETAAEIGITPTTLYRWRTAVPAFENAIEEALATFEGDADVNMRVLHPLAAASLQELVAAENQGIRLSACKAVLEYAEKAMARKERLTNWAALSRRLDEIEERLNGLPRAMEALDNDDVTVLPVGRVATRARSSGNPCE